MHGTADTVVRPYNSQRLATKLKRLGAPVELRLYPGKSHVDLVKSLSPTFRGTTPALADSVAFLARPQPMSARVMKAERLSAFTDGVLAIVLTIMVLELPVPHGTDGRDGAHLWPYLGAYALSFVNIGIFWNNHHHLMHLVRKVDGRVLWANLFLLFWLSLIPFVIRWIGEAKFSAEPVAAYGARADHGGGRLLAARTRDHHRRRRRGRRGAARNRGRHRCCANACRWPAICSPRGSPSSRRSSPSPSTSRSPHGGSSPTGGSKRKSKKRSKPKATAAWTLEAGQRPTPT